MDIQGLYKYKDFEALWDRLATTIITGRRHKYYDRTVEVADRNYSFITGDNQEELVISYKENETAEQKTQRQRLHNSITQHLSVKAMNQYAPINRPDVVNERIENTEKGDSNWKQEIEENRKHFTHEGTLEDYLSSRFLDLTFYDPNAWILGDIVNDDPINSKPKVYPVEIYSSQAIDYEIESGIVHQLTVNHKIQMLDENGEIVKGDKFTIHANDRAIVATEFIMMTDELPEGEVWIIDQNEPSERKFIIQRIETLSKILPAIQVGFIKDPTTKWNTYVSPLYKAEKVYLDAINTKSEYDLAKAVHGFLQKFIMAPDCDYDTCERGYLPDGDECPKCHGSGLAIHQTVQDIVVINEPQSKEEHIPLDQWVHYVEFPQHVLEYYREDLRDYEVKVSEALFNKDVFTVHRFTETATAKVLDNQSVNDALYLAATRKGEIWKHLIRLIAIHTGNDEGLRLVYEVERDFRLESLDELISYREKLIVSKAPAETISKIDELISRKVRIHPEEIENQKAAQKFKPFNGMTENERLIALNSVPRSSNIFVSWLYYEQAFAEIFNEYPDFYKLPFERQKTIFEDQISTYIEPIEPIETDG